VVDHAAPQMVLMVLTGWIKTGGERHAVARLVEENRLLQLVESCATPSPRPR
jgi:hypothetical protein